MAPAPPPASSFRTGQFPEMMPSSRIISITSRTKMSLPPPGPVWTRNSGRDGSNPPPPSESDSESPPSSPQADASRIRRTRTETGRNLRTRIISNPPLVFLRHRWFAIALLLTHRLPPSLGFCGLSISPQSICQLAGPRPDSSKHHGAQCEEHRDDQEHHRPRTCDEDRRIALGDDQGPPHRLFEQRSEHEG